MKSIGIILFLALACSLVVGISLSSGQKEPSPLLGAYEGKLYAGPQDPGYKEYDLALRNHLGKRIDKQFGVKLDTQIYSGFDLLEIEALLRFRKSNEPVDLFLKMFPKSP